MKLQNHYDWIILGDHPAALIAGATLSALKYSVLFVSMKSSHLALSKKSNGQWLDLEPNRLLGVSSEGFLQQVCTRFHLRKKSFKGAEYFQTQVLTPTLRIPYSQASFQREVQSCFGLSDPNFSLLLQSHQKAQSFLNSFLERLPEFKQDTKVEQPFLSNRKKKIKKRSRPNLPIAMQEWLIALGELVGIDADTAVDSSQWERLFYWVSQMGGFEGGLSAFRKSLRDLAIKQGATVLEDDSLMRIYTEKNAFMGVQVSSVGRMISGGSAVLGGNWNAAEKMFYQSGTREKIKSSFAEPSGWVFTLALTVNQESVPAQATRRMIWSQMNAPCVEIEQVDLSEYKDSSQNHRVIYARTIVPFSAETLTASYQNTLAARLFRLLCEIYPFLEFNVVSLYPRFDAGEIPYAFESLEMIPDFLLKYSGEGGGPRSPLARFWVLSEQTYPQEGPIGSTLGTIEMLNAAMTREEGRIDPRWVDYWRTERTSGT